MSNFLINPFLFTSSAPSLLSTISTSDLVVYYKFDSNILDSSGNGFTGTGTSTSYITNSLIGIGTGTTNYGTDINMDNSTSIVTVGTNADFIGQNNATTTGLSVFVWWTKTAAVANDTNAQSIAENAYTTGWAMWYDGTRTVSGVNDMYVKVGGTTITLTDYSPRRAPIHFGFTYDGTNARVYKNGTLIKTTVIPVKPVSGGTLYVGRGVTTGGNANMGQMDEFCLYKRALSSAEVALLYSASTPLTYYQSAVTTYSTTNTDITTWNNSMSASCSTQYLENLSMFANKLTTAGVWHKLDRIWIFATEDKQHSTKCLRTLNTITDNGAPTWTTKQGYTFAAAKYLDSNFNPSTHGSGFTLNSASVGVYSLTDVNSATAYDIGGNGAAGTYTWLNSRGAAGSIRGIVNAASATVNHSVIESSKGLTILSRIGSAVTSANRNGGYVQSATTASNTLTSVNLYIGGNNNNGVADNPSTRQISMAFMGAGLTEREMQQFAQAFDVFALSQGFQVTLT